MMIPCKTLLLLHIYIINDNNDYTDCINSGQSNLNPIINNQLSIENSQLIQPQISQINTDFILVVFWSEIRGV